MKKVFAIVCSLCIMLLPFGLTACNNEKQYALSVMGSDLLYENLNDKYREGEEVTVKVRIKPYEGVKVALGVTQLVKTKSTQENYWQFTFEMPAHDATLDIKSYKGFDEPLLYGFYLTFNDKNGEPIESLNKPVTSEEAIADYVVIYYEDGHKILSSNTGANVFSDSKNKFGDGNAVTFELEDTLYYTYELLDAVVACDWVYLDETTGHVHSYGDSAVQLNSYGALSIYATQNLSDNRYNAQMKEYEEKFDSFVKVNFEYLDYLTGVKVCEYGANGELIKSTEIARFDDEKTHTVSYNCEFVVIEEEYTAKSGDKQGETYVDRTLIEKSQLGGGKFLKYPRGDGLINPVYLSIEWQVEN